MKRINPLVVARRLILCLIIGGLLLPLLAGCTNLDVAIGHPLPNTTTQTTDSPPPIDSSAPVKLGSLMQAPDTVTALKLQYNREEHTILTTNDSAECSEALSLLSELKVTLSPDLCLAVLGYQFTFSGPSGETTTIVVDSEYAYLRLYRTYSDGTKTGKLYNVSKTDIEKVMTFASQLEERLFAQTAPPSPEEYLPDPQSLVSVSGRESNIKIEFYPPDNLPLIALMREKLTGLPLVLNPTLNRCDYSISMDEAELYLDSESNLVTINIYDSNAYVNVYHFTLPSEDMEEIRTYIESLTEIS